ncbi:hypothetical protein ACFW96_14625 [Streptomyces gardneri]|uniref:hypothetical protein n=1 Tax=Streptomyces gardneri TaxID=66892 RepID=UPI0036BD8A6F
MFQVELDIFSGVRNPQWFLTEEEGRELIARLEGDPDQISPVATEEESFGLGYRGFIVRVSKPHADTWRQIQTKFPYPLPREFRVGSKPARDGSSIADWLLDTSARRYGLDDELRAAASRGVTLVEPNPESGNEGDSTQLPATESEDPNEEMRGYTWYKPCSSAIYLDDRAEFNSNTNRPKTNCYCFACSDLFGGRYAYPGAYGGKPAAYITVDDIRGALYTDGWADNCQPRSLTIAAAVWPGQDYHFYRLLSGSPEWLWAHKPGSTAATVYDNSGVTIKGAFPLFMSPKNCDRGYYTDFVGWFYQDYYAAHCQEL